MLDLILLEQFVVNEKNGTARITENMFHLFFLKTPDYNLCACQLHLIFQIRRDTSLNVLHYCLQPDWSRFCTKKARKPCSGEFSLITGPTTLATRTELSGFLADIERRAFKQAMFAVRDEDVALDIVQDAMLKLSEKYGDRPAQELPLLFQRILQNTIRDFYRRQKIRSMWTTLLSSFSSDDDETDDPLETMPGDPGSNWGSPHGELEQSQVLAAIEKEIEKLPPRQREAFILRYWEDMDISGTAAVMGCSEGSVKTHCSRATHTLAAALKAKGIEL